jgi:hypothetical protein
MSRRITADIIESIEGSSPRFNNLDSLQRHLGNLLVEILRDQGLEAWKSCPCKKLVAAMVIMTMCWNMFSVKIRIMADISN